MKKYWFIFFILIAIGLIYILIPNTIVVSKIVYANRNPTSILRCLHNDKKWRQWFPGNAINEHNFNYNNQQYQLEKKGYGSIDISIINNKIKYTSTINVFPVQIDSSAIQWQLQFAASNNPFKRIVQYQNAKELKENMNVLLDSFKIFIQNTKDVYGFDIKYTTLTDTALVSIKTVTRQYPSVQLIYSMVDKLKQYIAQQHATEHNFPMLNITQQEDSSYEVMVGIPTNILLKGNDIIKPKRMIILKNKTLVTEVIGDTAEIKKAFNAIHNYMSDKELSSPVIPFQQLVTDRSKEKDSTKWITRIFSPFN